MSSRIKNDLAEMKKKLAEYINKGRVVGFRGVREEPVIAVKPDKSKIKPLTRMKSYEGNFLAVDCSTRTLKRANNWGVYLLRVAYALVKGRHVNWGYEESILAAIGGAKVRGNLLTNERFELESELALNLLRSENPFCSENDYLLLDGGSYFGGKMRFSLALFETCKNKGINLLTLCKRSPILHDELGRDFIATTCMIPSYPIWVYHPILAANLHENRYGDMSAVKLCEDSLRVFRCDIMEYLTNREVHEMVSPLTSISEDPRCLGYPVTLWLAHDFSTPSDSKLLHYNDQVEETLAEEGVLDVLRMEELSCNFPDELHGVKHPFRWEWIERV